MPPVYRPLVSFIATAMQTVLNLGLLCLGVILIVFLGKETLHLAHVLFTPEPVSKYKLVEGLVVYFLYFEFIALIVKYFKNNFHFPLDFFLYIGITAIVRSVIIAHDTAFDILIWAISIFVLVCSLVLVKRYIGHDE